MPLSTRPSLSASRVPPRGFSLLELMVAIAILGMSIVVLLQVQARSIQIAQQARTLTVATQLARGKLLDCEQDLKHKGFSVGDYKEEGKFDEEGYDDFYWSCYAYQPDLPVPDASSIASAASEADPGNIAEDGLASVGVGMIAPVLANLSQVMKDSVRELVVIVRWQEGKDWEDLRVVTHVIDKKGINAVAASIQASTSGGIPGLPGLPAGGGAASSSGRSGSGGRSGSRRSTGNPALDRAAEQLANPPGLNRGRR